MTQQDIAAWAPPAQQHKRRAGRIVFWVLVGIAVAVLVASIAIPVVTIQPYLEQSTSMQPTLAPGDRILAAGGSSGIRRGDIVVLRVPAKISGTDDLFVKRVIGLPGDHVACCDAKGRITVNGKPLSENYLYPGNPPSRAGFSVTVGKGKIWVMGDHRNISVDSRKWGPVPASGVVGQVILIGHGSSFAAVRTPRTFVAEGLAPADTRLDLYAGLAIAAAAALAALLLLAIFGIIRFVIRRRGRGAAPVGPGPPPTAPRPLVQPLYGVYRVPSDAQDQKPGPPKAAEPAPAKAAEPAPRRPPTAPERSVCPGSLTYGACPRSSGSSR
jgi:signal peptidase I